MNQNTKHIPKHTVQLLFWANTGASTFNLLNATDDLSPLNDLTDSLHSVRVSRWALLMRGVFVTYKTDPKHEYATTIKLRGRGVNVKLTYDTMFGTFDSLVEAGTNKNLPNFMLKVTRWNLNRRVRQPKNIFARAKQYLQQAFA